MPSLYYRWIVVILKNLLRQLASIRQAILVLLLLPVGCPAKQGMTEAGRASKSYNLLEFDRGCGQPGHNCQRAFQFAFRTIARAGGGTLVIPAGTYSIYFPGVAENIPGGAPLDPQSLIVVPPNTNIEGHLAADGTPDSVIEWRNSSIPVFIFSRSDHSSMRNLHLRFTGTMSRAYPFGDIALLGALGYHPTFPHQNQMSGTNAELFFFAYVFDSDYCTFNHLLFDSATRDNTHIYGGAIDMKGKGVIVNNGGGLMQLAQSNRITNVQVYDFSNAFLIAGQNDFVMENITADRRGSEEKAAAGHVLYTTSSNQWGADGKLVATTLSTNTKIQNITEGPDTYSNASSGGTLAIKFLNGAKVSNITSQHPEGILQTVYVDQNVTFSNMNWKSDYPLCAKVPLNCATPVIHSSPSPANLPPSENLTFQNISLVSTASPAKVVLIGDNLRVIDMRITSPPDFLPGQKATDAILSVRNSNGAVVKGYVYTPVLQKYDPAAKYNAPFIGWNSSRNVSAEVTINWPRGVEHPETKSALLAPGFQDASPMANNSLRSSVVSR